MIGIALMAQFFLKIVSNLPVSEVDCPPRQSKMRFVSSNLAIIAIGLLAVVICIGCNADPNCRREIALLRSEILDLEDQNAILRSRYQGAATELSTHTGQPVDMTGLGGHGSYDSVVIEDVAPGTVIYDSYPGEVIISEEPVGSSRYIESIETVDGQATQSIPQGTTGNSPTLAPAQKVAPSDSGSGPTNLPRALPTREPQENPASKLPLPETLRDNQGRNDIQGANRLAFGLIKNGRASHMTATEIVINRSATHGYSVDEKVGDEGLNLLIQPKSSNGQIVLQGGELAVSIINPKAPPGQQRIGRWKFLPSETELFFVNDELASHGILLHLPWALATPSHSKLVIHARLTTLDGRILQTSREVRIRPPADDYSPDDPDVLAWTQNDWRWGGTFESKSGVEDQSQSFDLAFEDPSQDSKSQSMDDWRESNSRARNSETSGRGFRRRNIPASPASIRKSIPAPKWRPIR